MESTLYQSPERVREFVVDLFACVGVREEDGTAVADNLIDADLRGVSTHGLTRIPLYFEKIEAGLCDPRAVPEIVRSLGATAILDAHNSLGQVGASMAMQMAIARAERYGIGFVGVRNGCHYGTAGYYALMASRLGMIGLSTTNSGLCVAPFGGVEARLGTNPVAVAIPAEKHLPVLLDMATSRVARGKLLVAMKKGVPVPTDWALDAEGRETTDAAKAFAGMLLPLGYKGYGMAVVVDMLSGILTGSGFGKMVDTATDFPRVGSTFMAINTAAFCDPAAFMRGVDALIDEIKRVKLADGVDRVYMPGEIEFDIQTENIARGGVPLQPFQRRELGQLAEKHGLSISKYWAQ